MLGQLEDHDCGYGVFVVLTQTFGVSRIVVSGNDQQIWRSLKKN